jgi:hypothetical protein
VPTTDSAPGTHTLAAGSDATGSPSAWVRSPSPAGSSRRARCTVTAGGSTCVPAVSRGRVRTSSRRLTGPTTVTSKAPSAGSAAGQIRMPPPYQAVWRAVRDGRSPTLAGAPDGTLPTLLVLAAAGADPLVGRAVLRHMHMADPPAALEAVHPRVAELLATGWAPGRPAPGVPGPTAGFAAPPRSRLVEELTAVAAGQPA